MPPNPYQSPAEAGYDNPRIAAAIAWRKDRFMLVGCGLMVLVVVMAAMMFCQWLLWIFGFVI